MINTWAISGRKSRFISAPMLQTFLTAECHFSQSILTSQSLTFASMFNHTGETRRYRLMITRTLAAGILGGVAMFIWTSIAHMVLPLGEAGVREIPNEQAALAPLQQNIGNQSGLYLFPGLGIGQNPTREQRKEAMKHVAEKYASNPSGFLVYHPPGRPLTLGKWLAVEFA